MTQEERNLLIQDLCARLPYGVIAKKEYTFVFTNGTISKSKEIEKLDLEDIEYLISGDDCVDVLKPYLRPLSSMTEEEREEYNGLYYQVPIQRSDGNAYRDTKMVEALHIDQLNKKMFDYRDLIPKGLALEAPEGMYNN